MFTSKKSWFLVICLFAFTSIVVAKPARFTTIDYPGAVSTFAFGINPAGDIVGSYVDTLGREHGFARFKAREEDGERNDDTLEQEHGFALRNGNFISFDWPGSTWTEGWGINAHGDIVGQYGWFDGVNTTVHGFLLRHGNLYPIDVPFQPNTMPVKISPKGKIVGCYHVANPNGTTILDTMYGFELDWGVTSNPMNRTMNNGVNPAGDVVGLYFSPTNNRVEQSYLIHDGVLTWFQFPGSVVTQAWDISPRGTIVGFHRTSLTGPLPQFHGFVMEDGEMTSFDVPAATATRAYSISATGDIVGYYVVGTGLTAVNHGFLLSRRGPE